MLKNNINGKTNFKKCVVSSPCSTANIGPGYDIFGLGLDALEDRVTVKIKEKIITKNYIIKININGKGSKTIPIDPEYNSSGRVAKKIISDFNLHGYDYIVDIEKNIPPGYGMGSSAASAVATAIAFNKIFELNLTETRLLDYAAEGEVASAGIKHYDNIAGSFFGDFIIVKTYPELEFIKIESPKDLILVVCVPLIEVPRMKTEAARKVLPTEVSLDKAIRNIANACTVVSGFYTKDIKMICRGIDDCIVEPARQKLIPGYQKIKERSIKEGALAFTISGAGPSTIAFLNSKTKAEHISNILKEEYKQLNIECKTFVCKPSKGSKIISIK